MNVIELSYDHLPLQLKPCFLYLASFPKDTAVHRVMLKMYWRAEGLVEQTGVKSLEEVMEINLDNLISSSLVIAFNEIGDIPNCQLHDLVHDFCLIKATIATLPNIEELFLRRTIIQKEAWNMGEEDAFENLKYLELDEVTLAKWEVGEESFPMIEKLLLLRCSKLTEIPPKFGDIGSLKIIQLVESPQLEDSALEIKQYVEDITGEDRLQILGPNNIPLSKYPDNLKGREGEVTLVE
ncbi:hypothetical protein P3S67_032341 [Capsicum chacoense]